MTRHARRRHGAIRRSQVVPLLPICEPFERDGRLHVRYVGADGSTAELDTGRDVADLTETHMVNAITETLARERVRLPVFVPDGDVPATRGDCVDGPRPCVHTRCTAHLWRADDEDRPGRRWAGKPPPTTLEPRWLETPVPPSCALDVADAAAQGREMTVEEVAEMVGLRPARVFEILATAIAKLKASVPREMRLWNLSPGNG